MSDDAVKLDDRALKNLMKALKPSNIPTVKIGVLGGKNNRKKGDSNAEIGAKHEFGEDGMPIRSFLRMPIASQLQGELEKNDTIFSEKQIKQIAKESSLMPFSKLLAIICEGIVAEGFLSGGFGKWKPSIMKFKNTKMTLVETKQLQDSISSEVK